MKSWSLRFANVVMALGFVLLGFVVGLAWETASPKTVHQTAEPVRRAYEPRGDLTGVEQTTIRLFEQASPSVVFITSITVRQDNLQRNVTEIPRGTGTGFVWDTLGHIVTNYHVVQNADRANVMLADRTTWPAHLVGAAPSKDLVVLHIDAPPEQLMPLSIGTSDDLQVGQSVYAIGNPFGFDQSLTTGVVSALGREIKSAAEIAIRDVIQTDAAINPGNSGGPLLDSSGNMIGVNTAIYSPSGVYAGVGFSIPVDAVGWVVPELIAYGRLRRPSLGVEVASAQLARRFDLEGALVIRVLPGSAAARAGIRPTTRDRSGSIELGDIIISLDDAPVEAFDDLILALERRNPGEEVRITLLRGDQRLEIDLTLDEPQ